MAELSLCAATVVRGLTEVFEVVSLHSHALKRSWNSHATNFVSDSHFFQHAISSLIRPPLFLSTAAELSDQEARSGWCTRSSSSLLLLEPFRAIRARSEGRSQIVRPISGICRKNCLWPRADVHLLLVMERVSSLLKIVGLSCTLGRRSYMCSSAFSCRSDKFEAYAYSNSRSYSHVSENVQKVGFIGLGNMGSHMAFNLLKAGHSLYVHDRSDAAMQFLVEKGASKANSPLQIAEQSDVIITMLPASSHVEEVYTGPNGLLSNSGDMRPSLMIDCSTIDPQTSRVLAAKVGECRLSLTARNIGSETPVMLDAPVSGGVGGASAASLTFMVGGPEMGLRAALPLLNLMGKRVVHCGGAGNGSAAKVCNNLAMAISMAGVSEAFALGQHLGIDALTLSKIFNTSSARCWSSDTYNPVPGLMDGVPASRNYKGGFSCQLLAKDLGLALSAAKETGSSVPLTKQVHELYSKLCKEGYSQEDFSSIFHRLYRGEPLHAENQEPTQDPLGAGTQ